MSSVVWQTGRIVGGVMRAVVSGDAVVRVVSGNGVVVVVMVHCSRCCVESLS